MDRQLEKAEDRKFWIFLSRKLLEDLFLAAINNTGGKLFYPEISRHHETVNWKELLIFSNVVRGPV